MSTTIAPRTLAERIQAAQREPAPAPFRPAGSRTVQMHITLSERTRERLDEMARAEGTSRVAIIERALGEYAARAHPQPATPWWRRVR